MLGFYEAWLLWTNVDEMSMTEIVGVYLFLDPTALKRLQTFTYLSNS